MVAGRHRKKLIDMYGTDQFDDQQRVRRQLDKIKERFAKKRKAERGRTTDNSEKRRANRQT